MTDKDMLEAAAKALGLNGYIYEWIKGPEFVVPANPDEPRSEPETYDWLKDDGDCARLESALSINVEWFEVGVVAKALRDDWRPDVIAREPFADHSDDRNKARRYASVRAAAAMANTEAKGSRSGPA